MNPLKRQAAPAAPPCPSLPFTLRHEKAFPRQDVGTVEIVCKILLAIL